MAEPFKHPPSHLDIESPLFEGKPHIWIQWKGTDVCCDIHCACGAHLHYDGDFMYFIQCPHCRQLWEIGTHVTMYAIDALPSNSTVLKHPQPDEDKNGS
jgi:hypothetical protein